jgi:hypothetical protein
VTTNSAPASGAKSIGQSLTGHANALAAVEAHAPAALKDKIAAAIAAAQTAASDAQT